MDHAIELASLSAVRGVAGLVSYGSHGELPPTVLQHLRHERHPLERAMRIERCQYLLLAPDLNEIPGPQQWQRPHDWNLSASRIHQGESDNRMTRGDQHVLVL